MWYSTRWSPSPRCDARNRYSTSHGLTSSRRRFSSSDLAIRVTRRYMVSCVNRDRRFPSLLAARRSSSRRSRSGLGVISALCVEVIPCRRRTAGARVFFNSQAETGRRTCRVLFLRTPLFRPTAWGYILTVARLSPRTRPAHGVKVEKQV